jgi:hypothetical protein
MWRRLLRGSKFPSVSSEPDFTKVRRYDPSKDQEQPIKAAATA